MKRLIPLLILFSACNKEDIIVPKKTYTISIDSVLTQTGATSLPIDANGFYHLKLVSTNQQPHRITGKILVDGKEPYPAESIEFESNLYWWLRKGDTIAYITKSYINYYTGQYTIVSLPPMIASKDELVPTINKSSYSSDDGEFNTIIAPIREMKGDTMIVKLKHTKSNTLLYKKIVLE